MSNRVAHFEIHADELARARDFYQKVFGWEFSEWKGGDTEYWMIMTDSTSSPQAASTSSGQAASIDSPKAEPGINGGLLKRPEGCKPAEKGQAVTGYVCTVVVENYDETARKILENGGIEALPKMALAGMAWQGYYLDSEKNIFGIHQVDPNAK